jgi:hypothetical protein
MFTLTNSLTSVYINILLLLSVQMAAFHKLPLCSNSYTAVYIMHPLKHTGEWNTLHNEELRILYSFTNIIRQIKSRRMRREKHVARIGKEGKVYRVLVGKLEGKKPLGRPNRRWEDGIRHDLREIGWGGENRVDQDGSQ